MDGLELIRAERIRQVEVEGWTPGNDDRHGDGELAISAAAYALRGAGDRRAARMIECRGADVLLEPKGPILDLVRAGALIAAEIDRLQRLSAREG